MAVHYKNKKLEIKYRVITADNLQLILNLFDKFYSETRELVPAEQPIDYFYEIQSGDELYSGPDRASFEELWNKRKKASRIKIVVKKPSPTEPNITELMIAVALDRNGGDNRFEVSGPNDTWVNGIYARFKDVMESSPMRNWLVHHPLTDLVVQLTAVFVVTVLAIYLTEITIAHLKTQISEFYVFLIIFLFLSNVWGALSKQLNTLRQTFYPKVDMLDKPREPIVLPAISFVALAMLTWALEYVLDLLAKK